ncbi:TlpA family protein disulfide reductase [Spirosoma gilvum]
MALCKQALLAASLLTLSTICQAQVGVQKKIIRLNKSQNEPTPITNQETGQRMTISEYNELAKADPFAYHLVPNYDEYGQPSTYTMRPATPEEHETHRFRDRDPAKQPKAGQVIAPFVMTDTDGKTYRSGDLQGNVVVLSFWVSLDKSVWNDKQATDFAEALQLFQAKTKPVVLGVLNSEQRGEDSSLSKSLPFKPIANAYGFHNKYHITTIPTFVVIDKTGKVVANLQGAGSFDKLKQVLSTVL